MLTFLFKPSSVLSLGKKPFEAFGINETAFSTPVFKGSSSEAPQKVSTVISGNRSVSLWVKAAW